ncbi:MAG: hypothetical protein ACR65X_02645 [Methylocystis sp.]
MANGGAQLRHFRRGKIEPGESGATTVVEQEFEVLIDGGDGRRNGAFQRACADFRRWRRRLGQRRPSRRHRPGDDRSLKPKEIE